MRNQRFQASLFGLVALAMVALSLGEAQAAPPERTGWVSEDGKYEFKKSADERSTGWTATKDGVLVKEWTHIARKFLPEEEREIDKVVLVGNLKPGQNGRYQATLTEANILIYKIPLGGRPELVQTIEGTWK